MLGCLFKLFLLGLAALFGALSAGAFYVGQKTHWTSDGPAMLLIMLAIPFFGLLALGCLWGALASSSSE